jgi:hypothetical protein
MVSFTALSVAQTVYMLEKMAHTTDRGVLKISKQNAKAQIL